MREKGKSEDNFLISFSDVLLICKQSRYKISFWIFAFGLAAASFVLLKTPQYLAEATFREKAKTPTETNKNLSLALIVGTQEGSENAAISLMKSRRLIEQVALKRGMQAQIKKTGVSFSWLNNIKNNIWVEWVYLLNKVKPALNDEQLPFAAIDIIYTDEVPRNLQLQFTSEDTFKVIDRDQQVEGIGQMGYPYIGPNFTFTIVRQNQGPLTDEKYNLTLQPLKAVADKLAKKILVFADSSDKTLLKLSYKDKNRADASAFLNMLMESYLDYLKNEQLRITNEQIIYLNKRQDESSLKLKTMMEEHAHALSTNMATIESLFSTQQNYAQRLLVIDLELKRLKRAQEEGLAYYDRYADGVDPGVINQILSDIRAYKQQADSIDIALRKVPAEDSASQSSLFTKQMDELEALKRSSAEAKQILAAVTKGDPLPKNSSLFQNPRYNIKDWYQRLADRQRTGPQDCWENCRSNFMAYLANMVHLLDVEENLIHERLAHQQNFQLEFQGIDLATANQLYISYSKSLDEIEANILHYQFIIGQMKDPEFELSSLSSVLSDPVSQGIIVKACDLSLRLKDQMNRSQKELDRTKEDLAQQRNFLLMHVQQTLQLLKLREKLLKEKILSVQNAQLELIQQKISVLEKHLSEYIDSRIHNFKQEKLTIEQQQQILKKEMEKMPSKWASEKLIDQHLEMSRRMVEEITKLVESKNISTNLDITQSAPMDLSVPPLHPVRPNLILFVLLGSFLGGLLSIGFFVMRAAAKGIPATQKNLQLMDQNVVGVLSRPYRASPGEPLLDADLDTLRKLTAYVTSEGRVEKEGQTVLLMVSKGVDYSHYFASLMSKSGFKVLYMNISFDHACGKDELPGILQYVDGEASSCRIVKAEGYDRISSGGISRFSNEIAGSTRFHELIQKLKKEYDWIVVVSKALPVSGEGDNLLNIFDHASITVTDEFVQQLIPLIARSRKERLSFIFTASKTRPELRNY